MKKEMLIDALADKGWFYQESFFGPIFCSELLKETANLNWKQAKIGKDGLHQQELSIRNDVIAWLDEESASATQLKYLHHMHELMGSMNRELFLSLKEFECHFAKYNSSGFYKKHLDQHVGSSARVISTILYLNTPESGGELAIYNKQNTDVIETLITPRIGTFVCFISNQIYHEVLPTVGERLSLTGWFRS